jgi:hypothetical protein
MIQNVSFSKLADGTDNQIIFTGVIDHMDEVTGDGSP